MILHGKSRKLNNKGFSLVEILIAMAILGVVSLAIYSFMNSGARLYQKTSSDADIQTEAQLVANSITDLVIDCEVNISYGPTVSDRIPESTGTVSAAGLPGGTSPSTDNILEIDNNNYQFLIIPDGEQLFYLERRAASGSDVYEAYDLSNAQLLAENVTAFSVDLSRVEDDKIVTYSLTYERGGRKYSGNYQVNLRNSVSVNEVVDKVVDKNASITKVIVTPDVVYVDVKGKDSPAVTPTGKTQTFTASSDAKNVTTEKLYSWSMDSGSGAEVQGASDEKSFTIKFVGPFENDDIPSSFNVTATSLINNPQTGAPVSGIATVYYRKILDMTVTPSRGVDTTTNTVEPEGTAVFAANISDYNLSTSDKLCTWVLEYKSGSSWVTCSNSSVATLTSAGSSAYVRLGSDATSAYTFRVTATSKWDSTWDASYEFGVSEIEETSGSDAASRGVEIDLTAMLNNGKIAELVGKTWNGKIGDYENHQVKAVKIIEIEKLNNYSEDDTEVNLKYFTKDGKAYLYLDYGAMRYTEGERQLRYYMGTGDGNYQNISLVVTVECEDGHTEEGVTINMSLDPVKLFAATPTASTKTSESAILIDKGGSYNVTFSTQGYNISSKNLIGVYLRNEGEANWRNTNANEYGMVDVNNYLSATYASSLGNRYTYVDKGTVKLTAKSDTDYYPTDAVNVMMTIDDYYKLAVVYSASSSEYSQCLDRSCYTFNAYVSNVEGQSLFISEPTTGTSNSHFTLDKIVCKESSSDSTARVMSVAAGQTGVSITLPSGDTITINAVEDGSGGISYYTLSYNGGTYYYNSTYRCWKKMS